MYTINGHYKKNIIEHMTDITKPNNDVNWSTINTVANNFLAGEYPVDELFFRGKNRGISQKDDWLDVRNKQGSIHIDAAKKDVLITGDKIKIANGEIHLRDQAKILKNDNAFLDIFSNNNVNIQANDKKGTILLNGGNMTVKIDNGNFCMDDVCINKDELKNIKNGTFRTVETENIYLRNNHPNMPKIRMFGSSEGGDGKRPELSIITDNDYWNRGVYIKPGNDSLISKITLTGNRTYKDW